MAEQLYFDLPSKPALGRDDFFVSQANALAVSTLENWQTWPSRKLLLIGPKGSGKTHLTHVWAAETDALVINAIDLTIDDLPNLIESNKCIAVENADGIAGHGEHETALFHLHNLLLAEGGHLLVTATSAPQEWGLGLPDLASRMQGTSAAILAPPDDALLSAVLVKLFGDRQLAVPVDVVTYLVTRMERSFEGAATLVDTLDAAALRQKKSITQRFAGQVLDNLNKDQA